MSALPCIVRNDTDKCEQRHILVKGCGKGGEPEPQSGDGVKSESGSDTQDASAMNLTA